jgi:hypothetical protein
LVQSGDPKEKLVATTGGQQHPTPSKCAGLLVHTAIHTLLYAKAKTSVRWAYVELNSDDIRFTKKEIKKETRLKSIIKELL